MDTYGVRTGFVGAAPMPCDAQIVNHIHGGGQNNNDNDSTINDDNSSIEKKKKKGNNT